MARFDELQGELIQPKAVRFEELPGEVSQGRAGTLGLSQGGTLRFADEIGGLLNKLLASEGVKLGAGAQPSADDTPEVRAAKLAALEAQAARPDAYTQVRDAMRQEAESAQAQHPKTFFAGELAGGLATTPVLPGAQVKTLGQLVKTGAALGAAGGLGGSDADLTRGEYGRAAGHTALGGLTGALGTALGYGAGKAAPVLVRSMRTGLENVGVNMGRRHLLSGADSLSSRLPTSPDAVREALSSGAIVPFGTTKGALGRLERSVDTQGALYGSIMDGLEAKGVRGPEARAIADKLVARAAELEKTTGADKALPRAFMREAKNVEAVAAPSTTLGLKQAEAIKRDLQQKARYGRFEETPLNEARREIASVVRAANEEAIEGAGRAAPGSELAEMAEAFVPVKQRLGRLIEARDAAERGATRAAQRSSFGLPEKMLVGGGLASGALAPALASSTVMNLLRNRGASTAATSAYWASRGAKGLAELLAGSPNRAALGAGLAGSSERALLPEVLSDEEREAIIQALRRR